MAKNCKIHPTAIVEDGATIGEGVIIDAYAVVKKNVVLKDHVVIRSHAHIDGSTTIGEHTVIYPYVSIGSEPQALKYKGEKSFIHIGSHCTIREYVSINGSLGESSVSRIGNHCFIMAYCHIAHNSTVGDHVIMSNGATLAGHVLVEDHAIIGGMTPLHQFTRIGRFAMVGGMSRLPHDMPPFTIGAGISPFKFGGLNLIGLKRHGFPYETRKELSKAFRIMYRYNLNPEEALNTIEKECRPIEEIQHWLRFCRDSKRGLVAVQGVLGEIEAEHDLLEEEEEITV